jgi:hypothetical protein
MIDENADPDDVIYPLSQGEAFTIADIALRKIKEAALARHFDRYLTDPPKAQYLQGKIRLGPPGWVESMLGSALLPLLVSMTEEYIGALVRSGLLLYPEALGELPSVPSSVIRRYQQHISSSDILRWQADQRIKDLISGSPEDWRQRLKKWTKIDITTAGGSWSVICEMIQRRHAIVHNGGRVDDEYLAKVGSDLKVGLELGSVLDCSMKYITSVVIELETWAICFAIYWSKHFFKGKSEYHPLIISKVVQLESAGRWTQGLAVLDAFLCEPLSSDPEEVAFALVNRWFCLQELGHDGEALDREIRTWQPIGVEAQAGLSRIEIGRAALLRDYEDVTKRLQRALSSGEVSLGKRQFREMPLVARAMREAPGVRALLQGPERSPVRTEARASHRGRRKSKRH